MVVYVGEILLKKLLSVQGVSSGCPRAVMEGLNDIRTAISSKNIQLLQIYIATYRKKLEEVVFVEEEFLYKKISKKDNYVDYDATADHILQAAVKQYGDLTALK